MSRFARTTEEVFLRRKELVDRERRQGYQETLLLYQIILLYSWGSGKCELTLPKLCEIYGLEYHNSTRRLRILREKKWVEDTDQYIRPLLIHRPGKLDSVKTKSPKSSVNSTPNSGVKITPPSVKITPIECNFYTKKEQNGVIFTPENPLTPLPENPSDDAKTSLNLKPFLEPTSTETNGNKSEFSIEECLRYVELRVERGERLETPHRLARWLHQSGEMDAFIEATLYPAKPEQITNGSGDVELQEALSILRDVQAMGDDVRDMEKYYAPEIWARLMGEMENVERES